MIDETATRRATNEELAYLRRMSYPDSVIRYFEAKSPQTTVDIADVRMYPIEDIQIENEEAIPGYVIVPFGYLNVASTIMGDTYCVDLNSRADNGEPAIVLVSHDLVEEEMEASEMTKAVIRVADSFDELIIRFVQGNLPTDFWDHKEELGL